MNSENPGAGATATGASHYSQHNATVSRVEGVGKPPDAVTSGATDGNAPASAPGPAAQPTPSESSPKPKAQEPPSRKPRARAANLEPWPEPVEGETLLGEIECLLARYVSMPPEEMKLVALWALYTYLYEKSFWTPYLLVTSPVEECGKSTLRRVLQAICHKAKGTSNITAAALFRRVDADAPTLLIDEWDSTSQEAREAIHGILNSGAAKDGCVDRCDGDEHESREFATFCPKAIIGIGDTMDLPNATLSRCISIRLHRARPEERLERFRGLDGTPIRRKCLRWAKDHYAPLSEDPVFPEGMGARERDIWAPLLAIADEVGGAWPAAIRSAALAKCVREERAQGKAELLLGAIRQTFEESPADRMPSKKLLEVERVRAYARDEKALARLLKLFGIHPKTIRVGDDTPKGYMRGDFEEAWSRYLPPPLLGSRNTATDVDGEHVTSGDDPQQSRNGPATPLLGVSGLVACGGNTESCCGSDKGISPNNDKGCCAVAV